MGMGFAPTWLRQVSPLLHETSLTTGYVRYADALLIMSTFYLQCGLCLWRRLTSKNKGEHAL